MSPHYKDPLVGTYRARTRWEKQGFLERGNFSFLLLHIPLNTPENYEDDFGEEKSQICTGEKQDGVYKKATPRKNSYDGGP